MFLTFNVLPLTRPAETQIKPLTHSNTANEYAPGTAETQIKPARIRPLTHSNGAGEYALGTAIRPTWSPLQLVAAAFGGFLVVLGAVAVVATGISGWTEPTATVWGFAHTPLLGAAEIVLGLCLLASSASAKVARAALFVFGALMAAFGAIVLLEPGILADTFNANRQVGVFYAASGAGAVFLGSLID